MEVWRHISSGTLSELFGTSTLSEDRFIRTLGWRQAAQRDLAALSPDARKALEAYAEGVNAWIDDHNGLLSTPFVVTGAEVRRWAGSAATTSSPGRRSTRSPGRRSRRGSSAATSTPRSSGCSPTRALGDPGRDRRAVPAVRPVDAGDHPERARRARAAPGATAAGHDRGRGDGGPGSTARRHATARPDRRRRPPPGATSSRAATGSSRSPASTPPTASPATTASARTTWSSRPSKTTTKTALLANDPHLGLGMPSVWYMNGLHCRGRSSSLPVRRRRRVVPGRARRRPRPQRPDRLGRDERRPGRPGPVPRDAGPGRPERTTCTRARPSRSRSAHETIKVAGGADVELDVRSTRHGPILNDVDERLKDAPLLALALDGDRPRSTARSTRSSSSTRRPTSTSSSAAFDGYGSPSQNFVYADVDGHIGYVLPGLIPIRADRTDRGDRVRSGSDGKHEWTGYDPVRRPAVAARPAERA